MELTYEDYTFSSNLIEESLKLDGDLFEIYIRENINVFMSRIDFSKLVERVKARQFLSHTNTLFMNIKMNKELYFFGEREEKLADFGISIIHETIDNYNIEKKFK